jgi:hypothetical protein
MNLTAKQLKKVALKLGYRITEGKKHLLVYTESRLVTTIPRGAHQSGNTRRYNEADGDRQG